MKKAITVILLLSVALFGFTTCGGPFHDPGMEDMVGFGGFGGFGGGDLSFRSGNPSPSDLRSVGLSNTQFSAINRAAGGGYKGYHVTSGSSFRSAAGDGRAASAARPSYSGSYNGAMFYALWENRQSTNFKSLIQEIERQTGVKCIFSVDWDNPDWFTEYVKEMEKDNGSGSDDYGFGLTDWYMAMGMGSENSYKVWVLVWAKNNIKYEGAGIRKGDMMWVYMDLSNYMGMDDDDWW